MKSDVYLEVLSYLEILIVVSIYFNLAVKITLSGKIRCSFGRNVFLEVLFTQIRASIYLIQRLYLLNSEPLFA